MRIGILALQGAFAEHRSMLEGLGADCVEIRQRADIMGIWMLLFFPAGRVRS